MKETAMSYTTQDKIQCLKRELRMRRRVYPRQVRRGKMSQQQAEREQQLVEAMIADYEARQRAIEGEQTTMFGGAA